MIEGWSIAETCNKSTTIYAYMCVYVVYIYINMSSIYDEYSLCRLFFECINFFAFLFSLFSLPFTLSLSRARALLFCSLLFLLHHHLLLFYFIFLRPLLYLHSYTYMCIFNSFLFLFLFFSFHYISFRILFLFSIFSIFMMIILLLEL